MDDAELAKLLVSRGLVTTAQLETLAGEGSLRDRVLAARLVDAERLADLLDPRPLVTLVPHGPRPPATGALETRDSDSVIEPRERTRTVTSDGRQDTGSSGPRAGGYPELAAGTVVRTRSGHELTVERELGRGGMGIVYLVRDHHLRRLAALKLMRQGGGPHRAERFRREAAVTAHLDHPSIPPVYETGLTEDGLDFLLLRYVAGRSLADPLSRLERKRTRHRLFHRRHRWAPPREILQALVKVGEALAYAHSRGIVHRDLKPDNIVVGAFGEVMLMDWGLARDAREEPDEEEHEPGEAAPSPGTARARLVGTVAYMAPEQAREEEVDARADVFALGAILVEALTGQPPFGGADFMQSLSRARIGAVPRVRTLHPEVAPELDAIAARATAARVEDRYASADELAEDLRAFIEGRPVSVYVYRPREWAMRLVRAHPTAIVALGLLVVGVVAVFEAQRAARHEQVEAARGEAVHRWADLERRPRADFEARLGQAWAALQSADRWHALVPEDEQAAAVRLRAAFALGDIALNGEQWSLAHQAYLQALNLGIDDARASAALARVSVARSATAERKRSELRELLEAIESSSADVHPEEHDDAVFEVVRRADGAAHDLVSRLDAVTAELAHVQREALFAACRLEDRPLLEQALDPAVLGRDPPAAVADVLSRTRAALAEQVSRHVGTDAPAWLLVVADRQDAAVPAGRRHLALVLCEALGRLGDPALADTLARHLEAEADPWRAAAAGRALVRLGQEGRALAAARERFGESSVYAEEVRRLIQVRARGS